MHALELAKNEIDERELMLLMKVKRGTHAEANSERFYVLEEYLCIKKEFKKAAIEVRQIREQHQLRKYKLRELKQIAYIFRSETQNHSELASQDKNLSSYR